MDRYLIIGNGVAATRAAEAVRAQNVDAEIVLVSAERDAFYRRPQLADVLSGRVLEAAITAKPTAFYEADGLVVELGVRVVELLPDDRSAKLADGRTLEYTDALVATGQQARMAGLRNASLTGISTMTTLEDVRRALSLADEARVAGRAAPSLRAVVSGDSIVAFEAARGLAEAGFSTQYLAPDERIWPEVLDEIASDIVVNRVQAAGVEIVLETGVAGFVDRDAQAGGFVTGAGVIHEADVVAYCGGFEPAAGFLPNGGAGLSVNERYETAWPHVYAAGDVLSQDNFMNYSRSWREGAAAGVAMAGGVAAPRRTTRVLNTRVFGLSLVAIGQTVVKYRSGYGEMRSDFSRDGHAIGDYYKKLVFDPDDVLVGALLLGNVAEAGVLEEAVRAGRRKKQLDVSLLKQMFGVSFATPYRGVECPVCKHEIELGLDAAAGDKIVCPVCGVELNLTEEGNRWRAVPA